MTSIKTTLAGIAMILAGVSAAITQYVSGGFAAVQWEVLLVAIGGGIGLIFAKDFNVSNSPNPISPQTVVKTPVP